mmetsp:Transcript_12737/g.36564  ORF Transcript_12737/g.36564 Transcript_12737/m.36564 type:complete len:464 (-) Transcript_12737:1799-3190(-)
MRAQLVRDEALLVLAGRLAARRNRQLDGLEALLEVGNLLAILGVLEGPLGEQCASRGQLCLGGLVRGGEALARRLDLLLGGLGLVCGLFALALRLRLGLLRLQRLHLLRELGGLLLRRLDRGPRVLHPHILAPRLQVRLVPHQFLRDLLNARAALLDGLLELGDVGSLRRLELRGALLDERPRGGDRLVDLGLRGLARGQDPAGVVGGDLLHAAQVGTLCALGVVQGSLDGVGLGLRLLDVHLAPDARSVFFRLVQDLLHALLQILGRALQLCQLGLHLCRHQRKILCNAVADKLEDLVGVVGDRNDFFRVLVAQLPARLDEQLQLLNPLQDFRQLLLVALDDLPGLQQLVRRAYCLLGLRDLLLRGPQAQLQLRERPGEASALLLLARLLGHSLLRIRDGRRSRTIRLRAARPRPPEVLQRSFRRGACEGRRNLHELPDLPLASHEGFEGGAQHRGVLLLEG